jgi:hypothetical protein
VAIAARPLEYLHIVLKVADTLLGRTQFGLLSTGGELTGVDQLLPTPGLDRLIADAQIGSDLGDRTVCGHQI